MEGAADIDAMAVVAILAKAAGYAAALLAMGGPLFVTGFRQSPEEVLRLARQIAVAAAVIGLAVLALRFGIRAARISGLGLAGAIDPMMLGFVWDSPLGTAAIWRTAGYACVLALLLHHPAGKGLSLIGTLLIAVSYTRVGHALSDPQVVLSACLVVHLLALALWVAALIPLRRSAGLPGAADLMHDFGRVASLTVPLLIGVGLVFAWIMVGSVSALVGTAYGLTLLIKVAFVSVLLSLAALNKWRLVPALAQDLPDAPTSLRRAITLEMAVVGLILLATATLTSVTTPPVHL